MINPQHIKVWADIYPFTCETKGGTMHIRPKKIVVTSNFSIEEVYPTEQDSAAIRRRFNIHHHTNCF